MVLGDAFAVEVTNPEIGLGTGMTLCRSLALPSDRFGNILRHAIAAVVTASEFELSLGMALFCSPSEPLHGFRRVLVDSRAFFVA